MSLLGAAYVEISANLAKLDSGLKLAKSGTNKFLKGVSKDMESLNFMPIIKNIGMIGWQFAQITAPITVTAGALFALAKHTANVGEELLRLKEKTGISTEELYSWKKALELNESSLGSFSVAIKILSSNIIEARSNAGEMRDTFKALEIDTALPLNEIILLLSKRFNEFKEGTGRLALATKLLGRSGQDLIPTLIEVGEKGLKVSNIFTEEAAKAANEFNDNLQELKQAAEELGFTLGNKMIPSTSNFLKNMQSVRGFFLQFFPEFLLPLEDLKKLGDEAWDTYVRGIEKAKDATSEFQAVRNGATSLRDLPFSFGDEAFQPKKDVPIIIDEKQLAREKQEAERTAKHIADVYKDMYDSLKFDTEKYYTYQKELLDQRREEEIKVTGDITLAWEAYYARLQELDEARILRSNEFLGGIRVFFAELDREGLTWAQSSKNMMESAQSATAASFQSFYKNLHEEHQKFGDAMLNSVLSWIETMIEALNKMAAEQAAASLFAMFGKMFIGVAGGATGGAVSGVEGTVPATGLDFGGLSPSLSSPAKTSSNEQPVVVNQSIHYNFQQPMDAYSFDRYLKRNSGTIRQINADGIRQSRNYAKQVRGSKG